MKKEIGYLIVCIGIISLSLNVSMAIICKYIDQCSDTFWNSTIPYLKEFSLPMLLSCICLLAGIILIFNEEK
ncbi:MAG: hypothetical protein ACI4F9_01265 [Lachnospiraceae bacterium]